MIRHIIVTGIVAFMLAGCAGTAYQSKGLRGGYALQKGPGKLDLVTYTNPGSVAPSMMQLYVVYRCAELAKEKNMAWFVIYSDLASATNATASKLPTVSRGFNTETASAFFMALNAPRPHAYNTEQILVGMKKSVETGTLVK